MLAQPWMNRTPTPRRSRLEMAQDEMRAWKNRVADLERQLEDAKVQFRASVERVCNLKD